MTLQSMTGFARVEGTCGRYRWAWELRSVNGKGLDLRLRVPDWIDGLEAGLRAALQAIGLPDIGVSDGPAGLALELETPARGRFSLLSPP